MKKDIIKPAVFLLTLVLLLPCLQTPLTQINAQTPLPPQKSYQFRNGQWFDGTGFRRRNFYSAGGVLTLKKSLDVRLQRATFLLRRVLSFTLMRAETARINSVVRRALFVASIEHSKHFVSNGYLIEN